MAPLPVEAFRERIVEKIKENRVTLIVGETGCGKSSLIPRFLLEENMAPILCTQPRRLAVVAIARTVAKALDCEVGDDVGYHIGHSNVSDHNSKRSRIVFKTAGVLLEQMRDKGMTALNYKVIILDEVHERSVESDLVLACVKQFLVKKQDFRLVLMSATADIGRYRDYFRGLGRGERVEVIAIPSSPQHAIYQRNVSYLEQVGNILEMKIDSVLGKFSHWMIGDSLADAKISVEEHRIIHKLILHLHIKEMDIEKGILVFLPTYFALEEQWNHLKEWDSIFEVHILHRSIDINQALQAMKVSKTRRKVILATNIAESSVTIPDVAYVIDSCRSLQVYWDSKRRTNMSQLVWVSKSQSEQRRGRTGRTCDGEVYRLVTSSFYNSLEDHESPAILRLSLREQVLMVCCADSKAINDPKALLKKVLDPPDTELVEEALQHLVDINALEKLQSARPRYEPTFHGRLIDGLPLSFEASVLTLKFCEVGFIHEGILIGIMQDIQPLPILHPFGNQGLFSSYIDNFFGDENRLLPLKKEDIYMGNLCAFQFWQRMFKDEHRLERLKQMANKNATFLSDSLILNSRLEEEWCVLHNLVQSALNNISEIYDDVVSALHRYRPAILTKINLPSYFEPPNFNHTCQYPVHSEQCQLVEAVSSLNLKDEEIETQELDSVMNACQAVPYVGPSDFKTVMIVDTFQKLLKEMKVEQAGVSQANLVFDERLADEITSPGESDASTTLCKFFANGMCNKGMWCQFSHSFQAERPLCKFFLTIQGCRHGDLCFYSHDLGARPRVSSPSPSVQSSPKVSLQEDKTASPHNFIDSLVRSEDAYILVLSDEDLTFTSKLSRYYDSRKLITTTPLAFSPELASLVPGTSVIWNVLDISSVITETNGRNLPVPWSKVGCVAWCVDFEAKDLSCTSWKLKEVQEFFEQLAVRSLNDKIYNLRVVLTMNNVNFVHIQVERCAREVLFFLTESFPFDEENLHAFTPVYGPVRPMQVSSPISYVFDLHLPAYAA